MTRAVVAVLAVLALAPAAAHGAVTVGVADLGQWTPNFTTGCSQEPYFGYPTGASTCTYYTTASRQFSTDGTNIVPRGYGVITKIRVKTANVAQGPMQVVTFRSIRHTNSTGFPGCCWPQYATPQFTPSPGGVTEIATRLPVMNATLLAQYANSGDFTYIPPPDTPPWVGANEAPAGTQGIENFDAIALTVLSATTPIPATNAGDPSGPAGAAFWPGLADRSMRTDVAGLNGVQVLLQGVWEPDADRDGRGDETQDPDGGHPQVPGAGTQPGGETLPGGGGAQQPGGGTQPVQPEPARLTLPAAGRLDGGAAQLTLTCPMAMACTGRLQLLAARARAAAKKTTVYGSADFSIAAGQTGRLKVKLTRAGRRKLTGRRSLTVLARATMGGQSFSTKLRLRRGR